MSSKGYFDEVAPRWESMRRTFFSDGLRDKALSVAPLQAGQLAADLVTVSLFLVWGRQ